MKNFDAINIEMCILGSIIVDETLVYKIDEISCDMFVNNYNKDIFKVIKNLYKENLSVDIQSIFTRLNDNESKVNLSYLSTISSMAIGSFIDAHINILKDKYLRREVVKNCKELFEQLAQNKDIDFVIYKFDERMKEILSKENTSYNDNISAICERLMEFLESDDIGIKFGIKFLDDVIGGIFKGELTTIAARSGIGKTALALQIMLNCVLQGKKVLFVSREMSSEHIFMRNITKKTGISNKKMKNKDLDDSDWKKIFSMFSEFSSKNLMYINDRIGTISELKKRIRQVSPDVVIVDYIQLMNVESNMQNREREIASLSRDLKNMTLDFKIPIIQLSQLNDEMKDSRPWGERPIRDSKAIFHDSNNVVYIHEPIYCDFDDAIKSIKGDRDKVLNAKKGGIKLLDLIVAKCRDGQTGFRHYWYNGSRLHFQHIDY